MLCPCGFSPGLFRRQVDEEHGFDLDDYIAACVFIVAVLSLILAAVFTYMSISKRSSDFIVRTKKTKITRIVFSIRSLKVCTMPPHETATNME